MSGHCGASRDSTQCTSGLQPLTGVASYVLARVVVGGGNRDFDRMTVASTIPQTGARSLAANGFAPERARETSGSTKGTHG
ncbi:hypothetical protein [Rubidibacter lacunae]|uniref:hypothetical protein n=1 Tax=Rubidibacter lacunae TaxID=582514 RepID=UPI0018DE572F|nr:hypothetical protein [Rubidibacter lacunae]